jgi:hypothetical protein
MSRSVVLAVLLVFLCEQSNAFAPTLPFTKYASVIATSGRVVVPGIQHDSPSSPVALRMIDPVQSSLLLAEVEPWVQPTVLFLDPFLNLFSFAMVRYVTFQLIASSQLFDYVESTVCAPFDVSLMNSLLH